MINQRKSLMLGDARDLLEARLPEEDLTWLEVRALAISLFSSQGQEHEAWDFLYMHMYTWGENLDVHFSQFVRNAKRANGSDASPHA